MSVRKRKLPSGKTVYEVRWRDAGRNRSKAFPTLGEAKTYDDEISRLRRQGDLAWEMARRDLTVLQLAEDWWERRASTVSKSTQSSYARHLDKRILPEFGSRRAVTLRPGDVERWMQKMRDAGTGEPTIAHAVAALQSVLTLAVRDGLLVANPVSGAHRPAVVRERHPVLIRPITVERMVWDLRWRGREREAVLLELLAYAGLRPESEAITLTWRQVTDRTITVTSRKGRQARPKTRSIPIFPPLARTLAEWRLRSGRPGPDALVIPCNGGPWTGDDWRNWQRRVFKPVAWWAYLPGDVIARDLRGSLASLLIHEGRPVPDVAEIMGHSAEVCLRVYAQIWAEFDFRQRVSAVEAMESARARVRTEYARWQKAEEGFARNAA
jgi:site-specific recombinase XerC